MHVVGLGRRRTHADMLHDINNPQPPPNDAYPVMAKPQASSKLHFHPSPSVPISASLRALRHLAFGLVSQESQVSRVSQVSQQHGFAWMGFETLMLSQTNAPVTTHSL
ncbi:hypothetical protein E4U46_003179 [Claviceps purpurea]|nr:hypothetical protein E4U27_006384 [Claviceps purpurea]KAG6296103.1 hypothetical protein E4U46_003179 [Claviceps purpurea]